MATATITLKKGTTAEWTESKRVLDDGELGLETTTSGHRIIRIGNGSTEFMSLPVAFDIEEVREIKTGMDEDAKTYYDDMVKKGTELLAEMKALATTVELEDDATQIKYRMGISNGTLYFEEITKEATGAGYTNTGLTPSGTSGGYCSRMEMASDIGRIPTVASGSETTYECDGLWFNNTIVAVALFGGSRGSGSKCGLSFWIVNNPATYVDTFFVASLSCKPPVAAA